jgi:hypothetical protein
VTWRLRARIVEPEETSITGQRLYGVHIPGRCVSASKFVLNYSATNVVMASNKLVLLLLDSGEQQVWVRVDSCRIMVRQIWRLLKKKPVSPLIKERPLLQNM